MQAKRDSSGPLLLALDTATTRSGIALYDGDLVAEALWPSGRQGSTTLLPEIERLLQLANRSVSQLTAVAVTLGPGSFSSLRVGLSTAKGLVLGLGCTIIGVPTLDVVAYPHQRPGTTVWAVLEAGRGRLTVAPYAVQPGGWQMVGGPVSGTGPQLANQITPPALVCGDVSAALSQALAETPHIEILPAAVGARRAGYLAEIAWQRLQANQLDNAISLEPLYVHGNEVR